MRSRNSRCRPATSPRNSARWAAGFTTSPPSREPTSSTAAGYEYLTNEDLDAYRPYFTPTVPNTNPRSRKHDFGGTIGGPVWIPKIYNGRNKTFFFFSEEIFRNVTYPNGSAFLTLPDGCDARRQFQLQCDLPGTESRHRSRRQCIGERRHLRSGQPHNAANGTVVATPFPGNIIPQSRFDPSAVKVQNLIPAADQRQPDQ